MPSRARQPVAIIALLLLAFTTSAVGARSPAGSSTLSRKIGLGVTMEAASRVTTYDGVVALSGAAPAVWSIGLGWADADPWTFDGLDTLFDHLQANGTVPMVWWSPTMPGGAPFSYEAVVDGEHDDYIRGFARDARDWGGRLLIRFAHEMNCGWFAWAVGKNGNAPEEFVAAWRHIWNIFKGPDGVGATNVRFVWSPNEPFDTCVPLSGLYPGDAYVDFVGFTAYNWGDPYRWRTMVDTFAKGVNAMRTIAPTKKVIITETATSEAGGSKARWIRDGYPAVYAKWKRVKAIVYFNVADPRMATDPSFPDWRLKPGTAALARYREIVARPEFQGRFD